MDITWENPPQSVRPGLVNSEEVEVASQLRAHPNAWARVFEFDNAAQAGGVSGSINGGRRAAFTSGFQAKSRTVGDKSYVYVRFIGTQP